MNESNSHAPVIIDLGKKKRKAVKALRRGQGKLMDDVRDAVDELEQAGSVGKNVQLLIVVVESESKKSGWTSWM